MLKERLSEQDELEPELECDFEPELPSASAESPEPESQSAPHGARRIRLNGLMALTKIQLVTLLRVFRKGKTVLAYAVRQSRCAPPIARATLCTM